MADTKNRDIKDRFLGRSVVVLSKTNGIDDLVRREGEITGFEQGMFLNLGGASAGHIVFAGVGEGIVRIVDKETGNNLYENLLAMHSYNNIVKNEAVRDKIRNAGTYF